MPPLDEVVTALEDALYHEGVGDPRDAATVLAFLHRRFGSRAKDASLATAWASFVRSYDEVVRDVEQLQDGLERCAGYGYRWHPLSQSTDWFASEGLPYVGDDETREHLEPELRLFAAAYLDACFFSPRTGQRSRDVLRFEALNAAGRTKEQERAHRARLERKRRAREDWRREEADKLARSVKVAERIDRLRDEIAGLEREARG